MNPFVGLEAYISFERCGIQRGKFITEKDYLKDPKPEYIKCEANGLVQYFVPSETSRNYCLDDGTTVPLKKLFTKGVFTKDRLERLDKYIQSEFKYADCTNPEDIFKDENEPDEDVTPDEMIKGQLN